MKNQWNAKLLDYFLQVPVVLINWEGALQLFFGKNESNSFVILVYFLSQKNKLSYKLRY